VPQFVVRRGRRVFCEGSVLLLGLDRSKKRSLTKQHGKLNHCPIAGRACGQHYFRLQLRQYAGRGLPKLSCYLARVTPYGC